MMATRTAITAVVSQRALQPCPLVMKLQIVITIVKQGLPRMCAHFIFLFLCFLKIFSLFLKKKVLSLLNLLWNMWCIRKPFLFELGYISAMTI